MTQRKSSRLITGIVLASFLGPSQIMLPTSAEAQGYRAYCKERAKDLSGYRGRSGNVAGGAINGAIGGAIISGILGGSRRDRKRAAGIGLVFGGISNANRGNNRKARIYRNEYEHCMRNR